MASATFQMSSFEICAECHVAVSLSVVEVVNDRIYWKKGGQSR